MSTDSFLFTITLYISLTASYENFSTHGSQQAAVLKAFQRADVSLIAITIETMTWKLPVRTLRNLVVDFVVATSIIFEPLNKGVFELTTETYHRLLVFGQGYVKFNLVGGQTQNRLRVQSLEFSVDRDEVFVEVSEE
ncbi:hypothetical protein ONZ45_g16456 [Pleurotus djamor]|nr:hypothetical protein ONZ45_g16456 [Pleurotus djamor]